MLPSHARHSLVVGLSVLAALHAAGCGSQSDVNTDAANQPPPEPSCKRILDANPDIESGEYVIDPDRSGEEFDSFEVECDMETDGGGWTKITPCIARENLDGTLVAVDEASTAEFDDECRPWTRDDENHTYHYTFDFPAEFQEFFLADYEAKNSTETPNDIGTFRQMTWVQGFRSDEGDISFGSGAFDGPETSYGRQEDISCDEGECILAWPENGTVYELDKSVENFRIGWGENAILTADSEPNPEGWYPWWSGAIWVR